MDRSAGVSRPQRRRLLLRLLACGLMLATASLLPAHAEDDLENRVKTAFIYNFAKFIDWPSGNDIEAFHLCLAGQTELGGLIKRTLDGKVIKDRNIRVQSIGWSTDALANCHMLYLNGSQSVQADRMLQTAHRESILTIGESEDFNNQGGIIRFLVVDGKVRFSINHAAARKVGLNISAKLLEVAYRERHEQSGVRKRKHYARDVMFS